MTSYCDLNYLLKAMSKREKSLVPMGGREGGGRDAEKEIERVGGRERGRGAGREGRRSFNTYFAGDGF